jgi:Leucine rich repeat/PT repeat
MVGPFPNFLANTSTLQNLNIAGNTFVGAISSAFCDITYISRFQLGQQASGLCFPACLNFALTTVTTAMQCVSHQDTGICKFVNETLKGQLAKAISYQTLSYGSDHPYTTMYQSPQWSTISTNAGTIASVLSITFNPHSQLFGSDLLYITSDASIRDDLVNNGGHYGIVFGLHDYQQTYMRAWTCKPGQYQVFDSHYNIHCYWATNRGIVPDSTIYVYDSSTVFSTVELTLQASKAYYVLLAVDSANPGRWGFEMTVVATVPVYGWACIEAPPSTLQTVPTGYRRRLSSVNSQLQLNYASNLCEWTGITCSQGIVTGIKLSGYAIRGQLPTQFGVITSLQSLELGSNLITGSITSEFLLSLAKLALLDLSSNQLTGTLPSALGRMSTLKTLSLSTNAIHGTIPSQLASLSSKNGGALRTLDLSYTKISGKVPEQLCSFATAGNLFNSTINVQGASLACYEPCWLNIEQSYRDTYFGSTVGFCSPTSQPSNRPSGQPSRQPSHHPTSQPSVHPTHPTPMPTVQILAAASQSDASSSAGFTLLIEIIVPIVVVVLAASLGGMGWYVRRAAKIDPNMKERKNRLAELPVHTAIMNLNLSSKGLLALIANNLASINERDFDQQTCFDVALKCKRDREVLQELLMRSLPMDTTSEPFRRREPDEHGYAWIKAVQRNDCDDLVLHVLQSRPEAAVDLCFSEDEAGRQAINIGELV